MHVTQRGVDRTYTFLAEEDFAFYRLTLHAAAEASGCAVHAYVLMSNHVHLLFTPRDTAAPVRLMMALGRRYVRYFNDRYGRTGTLWEGRYRSSIVDTAAYFFACSRYIELNPVRAGLAATAALYEWSSHQRNAFGHVDPIVTSHPEYTSLGPTRDAQCAAYRALFGAELSSEAVAALRVATRVRPPLPQTRYRQLVALMSETGTGDIARP